MRASVRRAGPGDAGPLAEMLREFYSYHSSMLGGRPIRREEGEKLAREALADPRSSVLLAEEGGEIVGFARIQEHEGAIFLREIYVRPGLRRRGVGSALLSACEGEAADRWGRGDLYLSVVPANLGALDFFLARGYDFLNTLELTRWEGGADSEVVLLGRRLGVRLGRAASTPPGLLRGMEARVRPGEFCVARCRRRPGSAFAVVDDGKEITVVAPCGELEESGCGPTDVERGYRILTFEAELPFDLVGFMAAVSGALAAEGVSLLALSSYSTDHVLVRSGDLDAAERALRRLGMKVSR